MIGKKVKVSEYNRNGGNDRQFEGVILDKIQMIISEKVYVASGKGGVIDVEQYFVVDHYLIQTKDYITTARCHAVIKIIESL